MIPWQWNEARKREFEELVLEHSNSLYNLAYRLTYNREEAADLVQDATMRAFRFYHKFKPGTNFKSWILTICRNLFINDYRKKSKLPTHIEYEEYSEVINPFPEINGTNEEIFGELVQNAIDRLPEEMRTAITLFYSEGLSYKEIAKVMDCPIGTVMSRLYMARQLLKKHLVEQRQSEGLHHE